MITQCFPNHFSSFTLHQYSPNKPSTIYQETIHTSTSSQHILNFLPSRYWSKFDQSLAEIWCCLMIENCLVRSYGILTYNAWSPIYGAVWHVLSGREESGIHALWCHLLLHMGLHIASPVYPPRESHAAPDGATIWQHCKLIKVAWVYWATSCQRNSMQFFQLKV